MTELEGDNQNETGSVDTPQEHVPDEARDDQVEEAPKHDTVLDNPADDMEISVANVLPAEFQPTTPQPNSLDVDVFVEEATQVDFLATEEDEQTNKADKLKTALAILFPLFSSVNLQHLKPLYVTTHIEGYPISKIFIDCGATVNIILVSVMKALRRSNDKLIPLGITMSNFIGDKSQTK
ncbi:hypothetical protein ACFX2B_045762 [Malus domestica]